MAEDNVPDNSNEGGENTSTETNSESTSTPNTIEIPEGVDPKVIEQMVQAGIDRELKPVKDNLNAAYAARDAEAAKVAAFEKKEREAEIQRLKDAGEEKKAHEMELAEIRATNEALRKTNIELSRDVEVRRALSAHEFRSDKAADMAFKEISASLIQDENGAWVSKSGAPATEYVSSFIGDEANAFLLRQKPNTGTGSTATTTVPANSGEHKSIFSRTQDEVLKMAAEGKLPSQQN